MALVKIATTSEIPEGEARRFSYDSTEVAVANLGGGEFRALDASCCHALSYLDEGEVDPDMETIECAKHGSTFDLNTGKPRSLPATTGVDVFPVKIDGGDVLIEVAE